MTRARTAPPGNPGNKEYSNKSRQLRFNLKASACGSFGRGHAQKRWHRTVAVSLIADRLCSRRFEPCARPQDPKNPDLRRSVLCGDIYPAVRRFSQQRSVF